MTPLQLSSTALKQSSGPVGVQAITSSTPGDAVMCVGVMFAPAVFDGSTLGPHAASKREKGGMKKRRLERGGIKRKRGRVASRDERRRDQKRWVIKNAFSSRTLCRQKSFFIKNA